MRRILRKGYPFPMLAAEEASGKWVLICCACSLLKTRKGRERNGTEMEDREQQIDISYDLVGILPASLLADLQNGETA